MKMPKKCKLENCDRTDIGGYGYCNKHYKRFKKYGDAEHKRILKRDMKCLTCDKKVGEHGANGYCSACRSRKMRAEGLLINKKSTEKCSVNECDNTVAAIGYCAAHYYQIKRYGCIKNNKIRHFTNAIHHPLYQTFRAMFGRCYNENNKAYKNYGGRGIGVCDRWSRDVDGFWNFVNDMGEKPGKDYSLDRIDVDKWYSPDNCKWSTRHQQNINKRDSKDNYCIFTRNRNGNIQYVARLKKNNKVKTKVRKTLEDAIIAREELKSEMGIV